MKAAKVTCKCGKQICYIEGYVENDALHQKEISYLVEEGYNVIIGENLEKSEPCLEPCYERIDCVFAKHFSTHPGFKSVYAKKSKDCSCC